MAMRRIAALLLLCTAAAAVPAAHGKTPPPAPAVDEFVAAATPQPLPEPAAAAQASIRAAALAAHVGFLASPALAGRGLGSSGLDTALEYVVAVFARAGVPPLQPSRRVGAVEPAYFQAVPLREVRDPGGEVVVERRTGAASLSRTFAHGVDCLFRRQTPQTVAAPAVFAGYGIRSASPRHDDYAGLDVRGKVVLVRAGTPPGAEWQRDEVVARYAAEDPDDRWQAKLDTAAGLGAAAVIALEDESWLRRLEEQRTEANEPFFLPADAPAAATVRPLFTVASPTLAADCLGAEGPDGGPRQLAGVTLSVRATGTEAVVASRNVIAWLEGRDETLRDEAVVVGAHVDHLGAVAGQVHPGADDNASGTAALLEIARALAGLPERPRRSVVFAFWTGEEEGKLGSGHYVRHPAWPLARTAVYVNLDMIGHPWLLDEVRALVAAAGAGDAEALLGGPHPEVLAEAGVPPDAVEVAAALRRAARATGLALHLDRTTGTSGGSDYRDFARADVPFVRFFGNFFPDYHKPGDTAEALDPAQVERIARLAFAAVWLLADR